ncbi:MAG: hypothetical protein V1773_11655 [bacterium]
MSFRFGYELVVGLVTLIMILLLGAKGLIFFVLFLPLPILMRAKKYEPDERELQMFYKAGSYSTAGIIIIVVLISKFSYLIINGHKLGDSWAGLCVASFMFVHGILGFWFFKRG